MILSASEQPAQRKPHAAERLPNAWRLAVGFFGIAMAGAWMGAQGANSKGRGARSPSPALFSRPQAEFSGLTSVGGDLSIPR